MQHCIALWRTGTVDTDILAEVRSGGTELDSLLKGRAVRPI